MDNEFGIDHVLRLVVRVRVGFATERDSGALLLKRTTPMPVAAYLLARVATALLLGMAIFVPSAVRRCALVADPAAE